MQGLEAPKRKKFVTGLTGVSEPHPGQLIQIDATPYEWFGGNATCALHRAIIDASGKVVGLFLTQNECLYGDNETMRQSRVDFGIPQTVYSDNHTIFRSPKTGKSSPWRN
uniref:transposase family protein n=1 Tax=Blautia marasmi TaxID=1917868 RepID=UPI00142E418D|nr:transposase family protein [Blautia marasmi]